MQLTRCPNCHARIDLAACIEDDAGRELLALVAKLQSRLAASLLSYLGLFRPSKQDLRNSRALHLAQETLKLHSDNDLLIAGMNATVQQIQQQRLSGNNTPLKNHNYLKKVLAGLTDHQTRPAPLPPDTYGEQPPQRSSQSDSEAWKCQLNRLGYEIGDNGKPVKKS